MATYNFAKNKEKNLDHTHTEMRLKDQHTDAPEVITQKQLMEKDHEGEQDTTIEKQLEKVRTGGTDTIIEKNLTDSKGIFGSQHRNEKAYTGDINKLEEKRLSGKKVEDEKYSAASETSKQLKWWEVLKKSKSNMAIKTAALDDPKAGHEFDYDVSFGRLKDANPDEEGIIPDDKLPGLVEEPDFIDEGVAEDGPDGSNIMLVTKNKEGLTPLPHINMELSFNPDHFNGDENAIREAALEKVLEIRPNLVGKIDVENFSNVLSGNIDSKIRLLLVGDEYLAAAEGEETEVSPFIDVELDNIDVGGTPITVGKVFLGPQSETMDEDALLQGVVDYLADNKGINVPVEAIQINIENKEAIFAFDDEGKSAVSKVPAELTATDDTDILDEDEDEDEDEEEYVDTPDEENNFGVGDTSDEENKMNVTKPDEIINPTAKGLYDFPIVIAESKKK